MHPRRRAVPTAGVGFLIVLALLFVMTQLILLPGFSRLEEQNARHIAESVRNTLLNDIATLDGVTADWVYWDATFAYAGDVGAAVIESNLLDQACINLNLNLIALVDADGQIVFSEAFDLVNHVQVPLPEGIEAQLTAAPLASSALDDAGDGVDGVLLLPQGPLLIATKPVLAGRQPGAGRGVLILGRFLDAAQVQKLNTITQLDITVYTWGAPDLPADLQAHGAAWFGQSSPVVRVLDRHTIAGYTTFRDIYGDPALIVSVTHVRDIYDQGVLTLTRFMLAVVAVMALSLILILMLNDRLFAVRSRAEAIVRAVGDALVVIGRDGRIQEVNPAFVVQTGYAADDIIQHSYREMLTADTSLDLLQSIEAHVRDGQGWRGELQLHRRNGEVYDAAVTITLILGQPDEEGVVVSMQDITERKRMEQQLRLALDHEIEIAHMRSRFISMASHDLRNPLAVVQSSIDLLSHYFDRMPDEHRSATFDKIQGSIRTMVDLLDGILTIGQAEAGLRKLSPQPLDLETFCQTLLEEMQATIGHGRPFAFSVHGADGPQRMDPKLLRHILTNLLSNAIKYSPPDCAVTFEVNVEATQTVFRVADRGIGIPQAAQHDLFRPFHRAGNVGAVPGTGLGLAIVKESVELHGGTIAFESQEGTGTTVTVTIPALPSEAVA